MTHECVKNVGNFSDAVAGTYIQSLALGLVKIQLYVMLSVGGHE